MLVLLSGESWRAAVKLQDRSSEKEMRKEMMKERGENGYDGARDAK